MLLKVSSVIYLSDGTLRLQCIYEFLIHLWKRQKEFCWWLFSYLDNVFTKKKNGGLPNEGSTNDKNFSFLFQPSFMLIDFWVNIRTGNLKNCLLQRKLTANFNAPRMFFKNIFKVPWRGSTKSDISRQKLTCNSYFTLSIFEFWYCKLSIKRHDFDQVLN